MPLHTAHPQRRDSKFVSCISHQFNCPNLAPVGRGSSKTEWKDR